MLNSAMSPPTTSSSIHDKSRYTASQKRTSVGKVKQNLNLYGKGQRNRHQTINPIAMSDGSYESMQMHGEHMNNNNGNHNRVGTAY
jgi:hypothetical protein